MRCQICLILLRKYSYLFLLRFNAPLRGSFASASHVVSLAYRLKKTSRFFLEQGACLTNPGFPYAKLFSQLDELFFLCAFGGVAPRKISETHLLADRYRFLRIKFFFYEKVGIDQGAVGHG